MFVLVLVPVLVGLVLVLVLVGVVLVLAPVPRPTRALGAALGTATAEALGSSRANTLIGSVELAAAAT